MFNQLSNLAPAASSFSVVATVGPYRAVYGPGPGGASYFGLQVWLPLATRSPESVGAWVAVPKTRASSLAKFRRVVAPLPDLLAALSALSEDQAAMGG